MPKFEINGIDFTGYFNFEPSNRRELSGRRYAMNFKPHKNLYCKSRKRFIRLLMSVHIPRNTAIKIADSFITGESWQFRPWYFRVIVNEWRKVYDY